MRLIERSYPHPVLGNRDDVPGAGFQATLAASSDKENFYIDVDVRCSSDVLKALVAEKKAAYVVHVECTNTLYRNATQFHEPNYRLVIPTSKLSERFEINVFACALQRIPGYSIPGAHPDYIGATFELSEGDIIALGDGHEFPIESEDALARVGSIMVIRESTVQDDGPMQVEFNDQKIVIILSKRDFKSYKDLKTDERLSSILTCGIVLPVLAQAITHVKEADSELERLRWFDNLKRRIEGLEHPSQEPLEIAQKLLELPIKRALASANALRDD